MTPLAMIRDGVLLTLVIAILALIFAFAAI
jgi:hypothetical protein